jgi:hypothetical protein
MLFQNIVKSKKSFGGRRMENAGVGTSSLNRGCNADTYLESVDGDALISIGNLITSSIGKNKKYLPKVLGLLSRIQPHHSV